MHRVTKLLTMNSMGEIMAVAKRFYANLHSPNVVRGRSTKRTSLVRKLPAVTKDKVEKLLEGMMRGKATGDDGITVNLLKDGGDVVLGKLAKLFLECLRTLKVPLAWKNNIQWNLGDTNLKGKRKYSYHPKIRIIEKREKLSFRQWAYIQDIYFRAKKCLMPPASCIHPPEG